MSPGGCGPDWPIHIEEPHVRLFLFSLTLLKLCHCLA